MSEVKNKVKFGAKNTHVWPITEADGVVTFGEVIKVPGTVSITLSPTGEVEEFFADDTVFYNSVSNTGYEGGLTLALVPEKFETEILGFKRDKNGAIIENASVNPKNFAMGFEFNGDKAATRHILYNCTATRPNVEGETTTRSKTPKTEELPLTASPAIDTGDVKSKVFKGQTGYDTFFEKPYIPVFEQETPEA